MRGSGVSISHLVVPHPIGGIDHKAVQDKADAIFPDILQLETKEPRVTELSPQKLFFPTERFRFKGTIEDVNRLFLEKGWSLGLPVIPPTPELVERMLRGTNRKPDEILWEVPPRKGALTTELLALHAGMAGCKPEYMSLLIALVEVMKEPAFDWVAQAVTTNPGFPLIIVNGPIVKDLGIASGQGAVGGGYHPNVSIGYFVNLISDIVGGAKSPEIDKTTLGQAGNIVATVIGENIDAIPQNWEPLNVEKGYSAETSTVTAAGIEGIRNINAPQPDTAKGILDVISIEMETVGPNNTVMYRGTGTADIVLLLCPQHASVIAREGWSKEDVKQYLFDNARIPYERWKLNLRTVHLEDPWYAKFRQGDMIPVVDSPKNIIIVVAGGVGTHSQYLSGFGRQAVTKPI